MPEKIKNKDILVICIDRDNDIGEKGGVSGPIIGRADNLDAAVKLGIADPSDSDMNALFQAIKIYDELKLENKVEIATLLGDRNVGIESDRKITSQLDDVLKKQAFKEAVLVSDGAEDEHVLPIIKTKINVIYTQQVIVKQSQYLETSYYMINDFIKDTLSDKKTANMLFGIPAIALILYAIFGTPAWRLIVGTVGAYLLIKGFFLESYVHGIISELKESAVKRQPSFFVYLSAAAMAVIAAFLGYNAASASEGVLDQTLLFIKSSIFAFFVAAVLVLWGMFLKESGARRMPKYITYALLFFACAWIIFEVARFGIDSESGYKGIIYAILVSGALVAISSALDRKLSSVKRK